MHEEVSSGRIVCVDGIHGTNGCNFILVSVIVVDEYGEDFPVAWCITSREDQLLLMDFLKLSKAE